MEHKYTDVNEHFVIGNFTHNICITDIIISVSAYRYPGTGQAAYGRSHTSRCSALMDSFLCANVPHSLEISTV